MSVSNARKNQNILQEEGPLLVIQPLVGIGDMVWHKPWIDQLIKDHDVILATKPASQPDILFKEQADNVRILPILRKLRGQKGRHDGVLGVVRMAADFRRSGAKRALVLHHSKSYLWALKLAGITHVAAFGFGAVKGLSCVTLAPEDRRIHAIERMTKFWQINSWPIPKTGWHIGITKSQYQSAQSIVKDKGLSADSLMILGIGAMHQERCWPASRFAELISHLRTERPELDIAIMGGPAETAIAEEIQANLAQAGEPAVTALFERFDNAVGILSLAKGYVGNDTSLLNIAAVLGVKSLGLFSQSPPLSYVSTLCHLDVITEEDYGKKGVILQIEVDDVLAGIEAIWPLQHEMPDR